MSRMKELESKLTVKQREAALLVVENELRESDRLTQEQMAEALGIGRNTLYRWRTQDRNFIAYKNEIADDFLSTRRDYVYAQLLKLIGGSQPSVKAIDLFMRRFGLLTEKSVVENIDASSQRSDDDIERELAQLDDELNDINDK